MQCWLFTQDNFYLHMMNLIRPGCLFCSSMNKEANSSRSCVTDYLSLNMKCCKSCKRCLTHFLTVSLWLVILYMQFYHWEWSSGSLPFIYIRAWSCFPLKRAKTWWKTTLLQCKPIRCNIWWPTHRSIQSDKGPSAERLGFVSCVKPNVNNLFPN